MALGRRQLAFIVLFCQDVWAFVYLSYLELLQCLFEMLDISVWRPESETLPAH